MVYSDGQKRVIDTLLLKTQKAIDLFDKLNSTLHQNFDVTTSQFNKEITKPKFF